MKDQILITNIQRFSLHDGPGIRTTVFCKGCVLRCPWCANPENLAAMPEEFVKDGKLGIYGRYMSCDKLYEEIMKDELFYRQQGMGIGLDAMPGGVTYSGGEALLQADKLEPLFQSLKDAAVHQCVETCLFVSADKLALAMRYLDLFYVDIKILDQDQCMHILHGDLEQYLANVETLFKGGKPVVFRVPVIGGFTDGAKNQQEIAAFLNHYRPIKVELIKEHNLGRNKYLSLGRQALELNSVTNEAMDDFCQLIQEQTGIETEICKV